MDQIALLMGPIMTRSQFAPIMDQKEGGWLLRGRSINEAICCDFSSFLLEGAIEQSRLILASCLLNE